MMMKMMNMTLYVQMSVKQGEFGGPFTLNIPLEIFIFGECYNVATAAYSFVAEDNYEEDGRQG